MAYLSDLQTSARNAFRNISFNPERLGDEMIRSHENQLSQDLATVREQGGDETRYVQNYRKYLSAWISAKSRCVSSAIVGPSNFPVRRAEKANDSEHRRQGEFYQWRERALNAVAKAARRASREVLTPTEEIARVELQIANLEKWQETMVAANKIIRKHMANPEECVAKLVGLGCTADCARQLLMPDSMGRIGTKDYELTSNRAKIKRLQQKIGLLRKKETGCKNPKPVALFLGGQVVLNFEDDRLQILFDGKPEPEKRAQLKKAAFHWSPTNKAWQRKLTSAAVHAATDVTAITTLWDVYRNSTTPEPASP